MWRDTSSLYGTPWARETKNVKKPSESNVRAQTYLQLQLGQWRASNVYLVLSSWNIAENPIALMELQVRLGRVM